MTTRSILRGVSVAAVTLTLGFVPGCGEDGLGADCELQSEIDAVARASDELLRVSGEMRTSLMLACSKLAGITSAPPNNPTDEDVEEACAAASVKLKADLGASASVEFVPGKCEIDASAQLNCEATCEVQGECTPGSVEARCTEGNLSVECSGSCEGTLICEATATVEANCEGECNGTCTGECSGTCSGTCDGECSVMDANGECAGTCMGECKGSCSASCSGKCKGTCTVDANAMVDCEATARCKGECSAEGTAPKCEAELEPPNCELDAECEAGCKGDANLSAECTPPTVVVSGVADADFALVVEEQLPAVLKITLHQGELAVSAIDGFVSASGELGQALTEVPACAAQLAGSFGAKLEAALAATVSVQASVTVSADVSASAGAGS